MFNHPAFGNSSVAMLEWIGTSEKSRQIRDFAIQAAKSDATILLTGETGAGKDSLARIIHEAGRSSRKFVHVNCGGLSDTLLESELFGHAKGAFTGAHIDRIGLVRQAEGGTLFFNEVANMSLELQARLLVVMEKRSVRQVGGREDFQVNTRIIAATNANLRTSVRDGKMREDFYHRLNVIHFRVPSLRERREDVAELAQTILFREGEERTFTPGALSVLENHNWPGNVRELENVIRRVLFYAGDKFELSEDDVIPHIEALAETSEEHFEEKLETVCIHWPTPLPPLKVVVKEYFRELVKVTGGNIRAAVDLSGKGRQAIYEAIKTYGLESHVIEARRSIGWTRRWKKL